MRRWLIALAITSLLSATALEAASRGWAWMHYFPMKRSIGIPGSPARGEPLPTDKLIDLSEQAVRWDPGNPNILRLQAKAIDQQVNFQMADSYFWEPPDSQVREGYRESLDIAQEALLARPSSPWLWSDFALYKTKLDEYDDKMQQSLIHATRLGPRSPEVQIQVADIGLFAWRRLDADTRGAVVGQIDRSLPRMGRYVLKSMENHGQSAELCEYPHLRKKMTRICETLE